MGSRPTDTVNQACPVSQPEAEGSVIASRREFVRSAARYSTLGLLGCLAARLGWRSYQAGTLCKPDSVCQSCRELSKCGLPKAEAFREKQQSPNV